MTESKVSKIQSNFQSLASIASTLNSASDDLSRSISVLDESLKKLNIGLPAWVTIQSRETGIEDRYDDDQVGYSKVDGKWCISLRHIWGDYNLEEFGEAGPWPFKDAPRELRLLAAGKIPEVIEELNRIAANTAKTVQQKAREVSELASVIEKLAVEPKPQTLAQRINTLNDILNRDTKAGGK